MKLRAHAAALAAVFTAAFLPGAAFARTHHHSDSSNDATPRHTQKHHESAHAQAERLTRLAAHEKAAWREHLAKLRDKPHAERIALKRHDRRFARIQKEAKSQDQPARAQTRAAREHSAKIADLGPRQRRLIRLHDTRAAATPSPFSARAAARLAAQDAAIARHEQNVAQQAAAHSVAATRHQRLAVEQRAEIGARVRQAQAAHDAHLRARQRLAAQRALNHQLSVAKLQAVHNAHLAAQDAHRVALQGDGSGGRSIRFWQTEAQGVPIKAITVDLNDSDVKVSAVMAVNGNGTSEPFRQMIERANPNVAVTGTFFSLDNLHPVGDIVIGGSLVHFGGMGTALCVTPDNHAAMVTCEWGRHRDWSPYDFVVACGPRLLQSGRIVLDPRAERFRDAHMLAPNSRIAVGITPGNKIVFAMTHKPIYLGRLAKVMRDLGATDAMNLDAGTSTGFYYNGATLAKPGRKLTNMIVVYGRKSRYEHALDQLVPAAYRRADAARRQVSLVAGQ